MELTDALKAQYTPIIDRILSKENLDQVSVKVIRQGLAKAVDHDVSPYKDSLKELIVARYNKYTAEREAAQAEAPKVPTANGNVKHSIETPHAYGTGRRASGNGPPTPDDSDKSSNSLKRRSDSDDGSPPPTSPSPKKRAKKSSPTDAELAAKLQAEENSRARPSRAGAKRSKPTPAKKKQQQPKKKSANKVTGSDDSEIDSGGESTKKRNGAFHKPLNLSPALSDLIGESQLSRPQTVKKIWAYVREQNLQNPEDKRQIKCDDRMRAVFKQDNVNMFSMNKLLSSHFYPVNEE